MKDGHEPSSTMMKGCCVKLYWGGGVAAEIDLVLVLSMRCCTYILKELVQLSFHSACFDSQFALCLFFCPGSLLLYQALPRTRRSPIPLPCSAAGIGVHDAGM